MDTQQPTYPTAITERPERPVIAIVVPCYNEDPILPTSLPVLAGMLHTLIDSRQIADESFILCVDDCSTDATWSIIERSHAADKHLCGIRLAHNRGQQNALLAGLTTVTTRCDAAITIDADLQDDPQAIPRMIELYKEGNDIVYGVRNSRRTDTWFKRNSARAFYRLQRLLGAEIVYDHSEYRLMDRRALELLADYGEANLFLRGIFPHIGLRSAIVTYDRNARAAGTSKYPLSKLLSTSIDGITSFTAQPMRFIFMIGIILLIIDVVVAVYVLVSWFSHQAISGWSSLMLSVWFLGSLILIALGIIGEYIGKIFIEVKHRPRYVIDRQLL